MSWLDAFTIIGGSAAIGWSILSLPFPHKSR